MDKSIYTLFKYSTTRTSYFARVEYYDNWHEIVENLIICRMLNPDVQLPEWFNENAIFADRFVKLNVNYDGIIGSVLAWSERLNVEIPEELRSDKYGQPPRSVTADELVDILANDAQAVRKVTYYNSESSYYEDMGDQVNIAKYINENLYSHGALNIISLIEKLREYDIKTYTEFKYAVKVMYNANFNKTTKVPLREFTMALEAALIYNVLNDLPDFDSYFDYIQHICKHFMEGITYE